MSEVISFKIEKQGCIEIDQMYLHSGGEQTVAIAIETKGELYPAVFTIGCGKHPLILLDKIGYKNNDINPTEIHLTGYNHEWQIWAINCYREICYICLTKV